MHLGEKLPYAEACKELKSNAFRNFIKSSGNTLSGYERAHVAQFPDLRVKPKFKVSKTDRFFTIGSCFARNIEKYLDKAGIDCVTSKYNFPGQFYNSGGMDRNGAVNAFTPSSMLDVIKLSQREDKAQAGIIQLDDDEYADMMLSGLRPLSGDEVATARGLLLKIYEDAAQADVHIVTLGFTESWFDLEDKIYINGSPASSVRTARRGDRYAFHNLTPVQTMEKVSQIAEGLRALSGDRAKIILTVSPVPLTSTFTARDVISANLYSKSTLLGAAVAVADQYDFVDYMPSYELVTMSRRDLAWEEDGAHVKPSLVGQVVDFFSRNYFAD